MSRLSATFVATQAQGAEADLAAHMIKHAPHRSRPPRSWPGRAWWPMCSPPGSRRVS